jgi:acyl-CoA synthetase (AMP-forming)/AMP-acid ligase II
MVFYQPFQDGQPSWPARLVAVADPNPNNEFVNPFTLLQQWAELTPDAPALVLPGIAINFADLHAKSEALALSLADKGIGAGKRVFTQLPSDLDWITTLALMRVGAISMSLTQSEIKPEIVSEFDFGVVAKPISGQALGLESKIITIGPEAMVLDAEVEMVSDPYTFADEDQLRVILAEDAQGNPGLGYLSLASLGRRVEAMEEIQTAIGYELNLSDLGSWFGLVSALWQLKQGRPLVTLGKLGLSSVVVFAPLPIESISGSPVELATAAVILSEFDVAFKGLRTLLMAGTALSESFYPHIRDSLDVEIVNVLGDPILGFTFINLPWANHQIQDLGKLMSGVKAKITDDLGRPSVPGDVGNLSLKSPFVSLDAGAPASAGADESEYLDSGKMAIFNEGRYRLAFEEASWSDIRSDLFLSREIESFVSGVSGVSEVALVKAFGSLGEPVIALAVSAEEDTELESIFNDVRASFPDSKLSHIVRVRFIPRDSKGAPLIQELAQFVTSALLAEASE